MNRLTYDIYPFAYSLDWTDDQSQNILHTNLEHLTHKFASLLVTLLDEQSADLANW